jgi:Protein of unknown function (Hypoth_ymh)
VRTIAKLQSALTILNERVEESNETAAARTTAYKGLDLHPEIGRAASSLYHDGHYANAVEAAVKALNGLVRLRSGLDIDGMSLPGARRARPTDLSVLACFAALGIR